MNNAAARQRGGVRVLGISSARAGKAAGPMLNADDTSRVLRGLFKMRRGRLDSRACAKATEILREHRGCAAVTLGVANFRIYVYVSTPKGKRPVSIGLVERTFRRAVLLDPKCADAWLGLAGALDFANRFDEAAKATLRAIQLGSGSYAKAFLASIWAQQGKHARSRRLARQLRRSRSSLARYLASSVLRGTYDP